MYNSCQTSCSFSPLQSTNPFSNTETQKERTEVRVATALKLTYIDVGAGALSRSSLTQDVGTRTTAPWVFFVGGLRIDGRRVDETGRVYESTGSRFWLRALSSEGIGKTFPPFLPPGQPRRGVSSRAFFTTCLRRAGHYSRRSHSHASLYRIL